MSALKARPFSCIPRSQAQPQVQTKETADRSSDGHLPLFGPVGTTLNLDHEKSGKLRYRMPFDPLFWRESERKAVVNSWTPAPGTTNAKAPSTAPAAVQGFIVALPTEWTRSENNLFSGSYIRTIATNELPRSNTSLAQAQDSVLQGEVAV